MPRRGNTRKKRRTHVVEDESAKSALVSNDPSQKIPKSVVVRRGKVESEVNELIDDIRRMMMPHTALNLSTSSTRRLKLIDYAKQLSGALGVTHVLSFSQSTTTLSEGEREAASRLNLRVARAPTGPTLSFRVTSYALTKGVRRAQRRPIDAGSLLRHPPVVVTNRFGDADAPPHVRLMRVTFQNMFPAVNVADVRLRDRRRVVLFHYDEENGGEVDVRHYAIRADPVGVDRRVRRVLKRRLPDLGKHRDVADYLTAAGGHLSDASDSEDEAASRVVLPQDYRGRGNDASRTSALRLTEIGPRLRLKLIKVERGLGGGDVVYHAHKTKTSGEAANTKRRVEQQEATKKRRREEQEANVLRKKEAKEEKIEKRRLKKEERQRQTMDELRAGGGAFSNEDDVDDDDNDDESESESQGESESGTDVESAEQEDEEEEEEEESEEEDDD